jgi:hypothetical protein
MSRRLAGEYIVHLPTREDVFAPIENNLEQIPMSQDMKLKIRIENLKL